MTNAVLPANKQRVVLSAAATLNMKDFDQVPYNVSYVPNGNVNEAPDISLAQNEVFILSHVDATNKNARSMVSEIAGAFSTFSATAKGVTGNLSFGFFIMSLKQYTSTTPNLGTSSKIIDVTVPAIDLNAYIASSPADYAAATNIVFNNTYLVNHNFVDMLSSALTAANFNPETQVVVFGVINTSAANVGSIAVANNAFLDINANTINYGSDNAGDDSFVNQDGLRGQAVQNVALSS